ncbi:hypothetical protein PC9H_008841 [Pleurotus ostreatus]|uniref:Uncharacterized protein n=3 Tax=Pleurotus TaxID=5320 RepID=A0A067NYX0_PLEO1|nr:uncharacterized protein PC9H_008841 [Pleurotus ostreatus]KAF7426472.1 hypothetical protein PC9H_008841 [Pleurotus ostreatus]KAG9221958.1 hypothetical protein CCMSSC00406_0009166 [Pleurotus cornucopiae]KAJ8694022.1 hypothetical protein PTI98_008955 [Pleurotus ostreatus]KDQ32195.1 hypothetical protein PLEOSDRAFT_1088237 [Pleurotus ostreatus PC15]
MPIATGTIEVIGFLSDLIASFTIGGKTYKFHAPARDVELFVCSNATLDYPALEVLEGKLSFDATLGESSISVTIHGPGTPGAPIKINGPLDTPVTMPRQFGGEGTWSS